MDDTRLTLTGHQPTPGVLVVEAVGELDMRTTGRLSRYLAREAVAAGVRHVVLDLTQVSFFGSDAAAVLVAITHGEGNGSRPDVQLHLVGVRDNRHVRRPLEIMGLLERLDVHDDPDTLLHSLR